MSINSANFRRDLATPYTNNMAHLRAEFAWLEERLKCEIRRNVGSDGELKPMSEFAGMYVSQLEMQNYLDSDIGEIGKAFPEDRTSNRIMILRETIDRRVEASLAAGVELRLYLLANRFDLSKTELRIMMFCGVPEVDIRYQHCLAYLQDDVSKKRPTVQILTKLVENCEDVIDLHETLGPNGALGRNQLVITHKDSETRDIPFSTRQLALGPGIFDYLLGDDHVDKRLREHADLILSQPIETHWQSQRHLKDIVKYLQGRETDCEGLPTPYVFGLPGSERSQLIEAVAASMKRKLLRVKTPSLFASSGLANELFQCIIHDTRLHNAIILFEDVDVLVSESTGSGGFATILSQLIIRQSSLSVVMTGSRPPFEVTQVIHSALAGFEIKIPTMDERYEIWSSLVRGVSGSGAEQYINELAAKFRFTPGQIRGVINKVTTLSNSKGSESAVLHFDDLYRHCRESSNQQLMNFARKIAPSFQWDDVVLLLETQNQLHEICAHIRHRRTVYSKWGFESKLSVGKGLNVLFTGPSGTGKTMSSEVIAGDLGVDLYKIDLSCVVSKYVGETERNLEQIFQEAESSNSILLFDEADALFGKRSEVKDAHDRYANIEINYLLQRLDDYQGFVILTTNLKGNLDAAFLRRLAYVVDFPSPDPEMRMAIWQGVFPADVPVSSDVDLMFLARKFELSGGNIKNIALNGAFLAARANSDVRMMDLILATKREYKKMGKLCSKSDFGPYINLVRQEE